MGQVIQLIETVIRRLDAVIASGSDEELRHVATEPSLNIQRLLEIASAIIKGSERPWTRARSTHFLVISWRRRRRGD